MDMIVSLKAIYQKVYVVLLRKTGAYLVRFSSLTSRLLTALASQFMFMIIEQVRESYGAITQPDRYLSEYSQGGRQGGNMGSLLSHNSRI